MSKETMEFDVSNETVAVEVALGILGRAMDLHEDPVDDNEDIAVELRDLGQELLAEYEETYSLDRDSE